MTALVIDDNPSMRETLQTLLSIYAPQIQVVGEADGVKSGIAKIKQTSPDIVFLDVEMTDGTGFDLLTQFGQVDFKIIFVTGHDKFAIKAFKFSAIDYILKPIDPDDLVRAIAKANQLLPQDNSLRVENLVQNQIKSTTEKRIILNDTDNTYLISILDIIRCESDVNYTNFFLKDGRRILVSKTLKIYEEILEEFKFFRSHQSHLINLHYFDRLDKSEGGIIYLKNGDSVPISTRKREQLIGRLNLM